MLRQPAAVLDQPGHLVSNDIPSSVFSHNILFPAHHSGNTVQLQASSSNCCKNHTHCSTNLFFLISHGILAPEGYCRFSMQDSAGLHMLLLSSGQMTVQGKH